MILRLLASLVLTLALTSLAAAQTPTATATESKEEREKAEKALESKALKLLGETLDGAQMLKLPENRALVQATAGDLFWTHDEKRARQLFQDAMASLAEASSSTDGKNLRRDNTFWAVTQMRLQILQLIARRDAQMALDLLRASRPADAEVAGPGPGRRDEELMLEHSIAAQVASDDPARALKMAQESLNKGMTVGLINVLYRLQRKDAEAATRLASDIIRKLQTENLTTNYQAAFVAMNLLRSILLARTPPAAPVAGEAAKVKPLALEDQTVRDLAETIVNNAISVSNNDASLLMEIQSFLPELEKLLPERMPQVRKRLADVRKNLDPERKGWMDYAALMRSNTKPEAILEAAAKVPPEMRPELYKMAAWKLVQAGEAERARAVATENLSGQERDDLLASLDQYAIAAALKQGKIDEARKIVSRISSKDARARAFAQLAVGVISAKGERQVALELLDEARNLISRQPDNQREAEALLQVAGAYALVEPARSFELVDPLIDQANEMLSAAALLDRFGSSSGFFRKGEMIFQPNFAASFGPYSPYMKQLGALARADFERTKTLADRFQRQDARLLARLLLAQSLLTDRLSANNPEGAMMTGGLLVGY